MSTSPQPLALRDRLLPRDVRAVREIVRSTKFFTPEEEDIAVELVQETLDRGDASGYGFLFLEDAERSLAYTCFGRIPGTDTSFDLYWIATREECRGSGLGRRVLVATEERIASLGGTRIYVETSSREQYQPTRRFYERCGYPEVARLPDFYRVDDGKVIYCKVLPPARPEGSAR